MPPSPFEIVTAYCEAWNATADSERRALLEKSWADGGAYADPRTVLAGRDALFAHIAKVQAARPGSRIVMTSGLDVHHGALRFAWKLVNPQGGTVAEGIDFGELAADGRLQRIIGFFGPLPRP
jgi:hypothetical protein